MKVSDILRVKGGTLFTVASNHSLADAIQIMGERDIGSLVVMDQGELTGMLTFREVILALVKNNGAVGSSTVGGVKDDHPLPPTRSTARSRRTARTSRPKVRRPT